ncbi:MAG: hypothetical protein JJE03_05560 [Peptostreptococcaceae bacterium]|nr:hypothetical protein [Peptostreptococcaceae bacterium]
MFLIIFKVRNLLSNEKYTDTVRLLDFDKYEVQYVSEKNNLAIVSKETFDAVLLKKARRSNVVKGEHGKKRKDKKYSSKK